MAARPLVAWLVQELMFIKKLSLMLGSRKKLFFPVFASDAFCGSLSEPIDSTVFVRERVLRHKRAR